MQDGGFSSLGAIIKQKIYHFDTVADMKNCLTLIPGDVVQTNGYYMANDGGQGVYEIVNDSSLEDDGGSIHNLINELKAKLIVKDSINVKQFGCRGDGITDDSMCMQKALNYVKVCGNSNTLLIPPGKFFLAATLNIPSNIRIIGNSKTMYHDYGIKSSILVRRSNIVLLSLSGKPYTENSGDVRASDILIEDLTLLSETDTYFDKPILYTKRAIYNYFNRLVFRGNGKAIYFDIASFDSRFMNCDFVGNCDIETVESYDDNYNSAIFYGVNQMIFFGCRWEGFNKGNLIKLNNYSREFFFFAPKFEGCPTDGNPILYTQRNNADVYMYGARVTLLGGSNSYFANLNDLSRSLFDISYVDNSTKHDNALIKINNTASINFLFKPSFNVDDYNIDFYIENEGSNTSFKFDSTLISLPYFSNAKNLFSAPEKMNIDNILFDSTVSTSNVPNRMLMNIEKQGGHKKIWKWLLNYYNFTDEVTQLTLVDADNNACATFRNGGFIANKRLSIPYLSKQPDTISNGDILINNYSDSEIPNLTIGVGNSSKRIGWGENKPMKGYWIKGNIIYNSNPIPGGEIGWICVETGIPGAWKSLGTIEI